jgi:hypothetical protein
MDTIALWARNGDAVRQAIELGELVHLDTASEELTDEFLLFAIQSGLLSKWAQAFPDPRHAPEIGMEVLLASHLAARFAGLYSMRKAGYVLRSASVLGALGYSVEVLEPEQGLSVRGTADDKLMSGDVLRKLLVKLENQVDLKAPVRMPSVEPSPPVKVRQRASRRAVKGVVDEAQAEARAQRVAAKLVDWYNAHVGPSLLQYARVGKGRRIHIVDTTDVEVCLETALLPTSPRESRFSMAYSHPYEGNPMTWRAPCRSRPRCTRSTNLTNEPRSLSTGARRGRTPASAFPKRSGIMPSRWPRPCRPRAWPNSYGCA